MTTNLPNQQTPDPLRKVLVIIWAFSLPLIWFLLTPKPENNWNALKETERTLAQTQRTVEAYRRKYGHLPEDIADIRLFARGLDRKYSPYDGYGRRLQYLPLSREHYVVRSYGKDGNDNTFHSAEDPTLSSLPRLPLLPPQYREPPQEGAMRLYPAILLMGAKSPKNDLVAQLLVDYNGQKRQLLVRDLKKPRFHMIANHSGVEEFFWLPSGYEIVFTATNADRYQDGIFIWNVLTNEMRNLMNEFQQIFNIAKGREVPEYYLSLSSLDKTGSNFYIFVAQKMGPELEPERFYSSEFFYKVSIPKKTSAPVTFEWMHGKIKSTPFKTVPETIQDIFTPFVGNEAQVEWSRLPTSGSIQYVIEKWQDFSVTNAKTPVFPYALWWLSSIYSDAYKVLEKKSKREANTLRAYGAELARALNKLSMAPTYLQAMGASVQRRLSSSNVLPYRISEMTLGDSENDRLPEPTP